LLSWLLYDPEVQDMHVNAETKDKATENLRRLSGDQADIWGCLPHPRRRILRAFADELLVIFNVAGR
jgi:hypothetical protein